MKLTYEGLNSEHMLEPPKPRRKITKFSDGKNCYCIVDGEKIVHISFPTSSTNEQGFTRHFMGSKKISLLEFSNLNSTLA